jgi:hypothetical protein
MSDARGNLHTAAMIVEQETGRRCAAQQPVTAPGVIGQDIPGRRMRRNQAGLAEFRPPDRENALAELYIGPLQFERLTDTQTPHRQKPEQAVVCPRPQALTGRKLQGYCQQLLNLRFRIQIGMRTLGAKRE